MNEEQSDFDSHHSEDCYWSTSAEEQLRRLNSSAAGLTSSEATRQLAVNGPNRLRPRRNSIGFRCCWLNLRVRSR